MRFIHKYEVPGSIGVPFSLTLTPTTKFMHFDVDRFNNLCVWCEVNTTEPQEIWRLVVLPTGAGINAYDMHHLATVVVRDSGLVWHLYRITKNGD